MHHLTIHCENYYLQEENTRWDEKTIGALARRMPNIDDPKQSNCKRKILGSVINSIIVYAAPVWSKVIRNQRLTAEQTRIH